MGFEVKEESKNGYELKTKKENHKKEEEKKFSKRQLTTVKETQQR
uniref:Uncharacterized protein n=1 Tax=Rhizophora mucronata TaxID=61149 RepID=A0A2P2MJY0_RHIMU